MSNLRIFNNPSSSPIIFETVESLASYNISLYSNLDLSL